MMSLFGLDRLSIRIVPVLAVSLAVVAAGAAHSAEPWPSTGPEIGPAYQKIQSALDTDSRVEFIETPLDQVVDYLENQHEVPMELDVIALEDVGIGVDVPVTASIKGVTLGSTLKLVLGQLDLTYVIRNEVLMITTREAAALKPEVRVYNVARLLDDDMDAGNLAMTLYQVLQLGSGGGGGPGGMGGGFFAVQDEAYGGEADGYGMALGGQVPSAVQVCGPVARIVPYKRLLIVRHTTTGQENVAKLLGAIAAASEEENKASDR